MSKVNVGIESSSWINIAAGAAAMGVAFYEGGTTTTPYWSALIAGGILVLLGAYTAYAAANDKARSAMGFGIAGLVVGLWLAAYPFFVGVSDLYFWTTLVAGIVAAIVSGFEIWAANREPRTSTRRPTA